MVARGSTVLLVVLVSLLAGCTSSAPRSKGSGDDGPTDAPQPSASAGFGAIHGFVVDEEKVGITGVQVGILKLDRLEKTDAQGAFTFNDVAPGTYSVAADRLGFDPTSISVEVVEGDVSEVTIPLRAMLALQNPIYATVPLTGYLECSFNPYYFVNPCHGVLGENKDHFPVELDAALPFKQIILELAWTPSTAATGPELELDLCVPHTDSSTAATGCAVEARTGKFYKYRSGPPPVTMNLLATDMPIKDTLLYESWVGSGYLSPFPSIQQSFTLYVTRCYVAVCPEGYSALPTA